MKPIAVLVLLHFSLVFPSPAYAVDWAAEKCAKDGVVTLLGIKCVLFSLLNVIAPLVILAALFMVFLGASRFITAGADPKKFASAKNTITMAVIGIVGLVLAWLILVIIEQMTGAPVTQFSLP